MAYVRVQAVATTTAAQGGTTGILTLGTTVGLTRHAILTISKAAAPNVGGWEVEIIRVTDATHVTARWADVGDRATQMKSRLDLSAIPTGAVVLMPEQWVPDLYSDDAPDTLALPVKVV